MTASTPPPSAIIFDVGRVLYDWDPRFLYRQLIADGPALDAFLRDVVTLSWHFQHDAGRDVADTSAELTERFPEHRALIAAWGPRFLESIGPAIAGMPALIADLDGRGVPLYAITNFSHEFWPPFRAQEAAMFDRFRGIVVSGVEKLVKPDAAIYRLALDRFGIDPARTVFVDDNADNVAGAAAVGLIGLRFFDAATLRGDLERVGLLT